METVVLSQFQPALMPLLMPEQMLLPMLDQLMFFRLLYAVCILLVRVVFTPDIFELTADAIVLILLDTVDEMLENLLLKVE